MKDILVHIPTERHIRPVVDASVSLAAAFDAHLDGLATGYIFSSTAYVVDGGAAMVAAAGFELEQKRAAERTAGALAVFEAEARHVGIAYGRRAIEDFPGEVASAIGAAARLYDLTIVLQPDEAIESFDNQIPTEVLFQSGRPVLLIPHIFHGNFNAKRIGICWDGSRLAARALNDARPLLSSADTLVAISIKAAVDAPAAPTAEQLVKHLARVGCPIKLVDLPAARADIQPSILSVAADENLDMLVMGAYGHSRLQEGLLGGVTREMLQSMTLPTLMSH